MIVVGSYVLMGIIYFLWTWNTKSEMRDCMDHTYRTENNTIFYGALVIGVLVWPWFIMCMVQDWIARRRLK